MKRPQRPQAAAKPGTLDELRARLTALAGGMTPRVRAAAQYALDHPDDIALNAVATVAGQSGIAAAVYIRMSQALGFAGYGELQQLFIAAVQRTSAPSYRERIRHCGGEQAIADSSDAALRLRAEPLTATAFAPFGEVIEASSNAPHHGINAGYAERYDELARLDTQHQGGHPVLSIFRARARPQPVQLQLMERHLLGSQAFVPLHRHGFLLVVAAAGAAPELAALRCFRAAPGQGVNLARGTWHHPLLAVGADGDFLVIDRGGPGAAGDCEEIALGGVEIAAD